MEAVYRPEQWHDLFVMIGSAAGALVGLLFIVVSLHFDKISAQDDINTRVTMEGARYNTMHLLTVLLEAGAVLAPQPSWLLGAELIALNLFGLRLPLTIIYRYANRHITISHRGGFPVVLIATVIATYLMGAAGGAAVLWQAQWALYPVALACLVMIVRSVLTAWMLIFGISHSQAAKA